MAAKNPHDCPGCGRRGIPDHQLACRLCWWALPEAMRHEIWIAYRGRILRPERHLTAVREALRWYREYRLRQPVDQDGGPTQQQTDGDQVDAGSHTAGGQKERRKPEDQQHNNHDLHAHAVPDQPRR